MSESSVATYFENHAAPPPPPVGPDGQPSIGWTASGNWAFADTAPFSMRSAADGAAEVVLRFCSQPGEGRALFGTEVSRLIEDRIVNAVHGSDAWRSYCELHRQYLTCEQAVNTTTAAHANLERKKDALVRTVPTPKGMASRLVTINAEIDQARAAQDTAEKELRALRPLHATAATAVSNAVKATALEARNAVLAERRAALEERMMRLTATIGDELSAMARLKQPGSLGANEVSSLADRLLASVVPAEDAVTAE